MKIKEILKKETSKHILKGIMSLFAITIIFFFPTLFQNRTPLPTDLAHDYLLDQPKTGTNPWIRDSIVQMYPNFHVVFNKWKHGEIPKINEYIFSGSDEGGTSIPNSGQTNAFSPLLLAIPFYSSSLTLFSHIVILHSLLGGMGMFLFLYHKTKKILPALLGAIAFQLSGPMIAWSSWGTIAGIIASAPWGLFVINKYFKKQKTRWLLALTFINYFALTAGHLQFYLFTMLFLAAYFIFSLTIHRKNLSKKTWVQLSTASIINSIFMGTFLIPFIQNASQAHRSGIVDTSLLNIKNLIQFVLPNYWGNHISFTGPLNYVETLSYPGILIALCALLAIGIAIFNKQKRDTELIFWTSTLIITLIYATLPHPTELLGTVFPFFKSFPPFRALFLISTIIIIIGVTFVSKLQIKNKKAANIFFMILILFTLIDMGRLFFAYVPQQNKAPLLNPPRYITELQKIPHDVTIYSEVHPLNMHSIYEISSIFGYDTTYSEEYYKAIESSSDKIISHRNILNASISDTSFLKELGVTHVVTKNKTNSFQDLENIYSDEHVTIHTLK